MSCHQYNDEDLNGERETVTVSGSIPLPCPAGDLRCLTTVLQQEEERIALGIVLCKWASSCARGTPIRWRL